MLGVHCCIAPVALILVMHLDNKQACLTCQYVSLSPSPQFLSLAATKEVESYLQGSWHAGRTESKTVVSQSLFSYLGNKKKKIQKDTGKLHIGKFWSNF